MNRITVYCVAMLFLLSAHLSRGECYLIAAASSGLGVAIAHELASQGHSLILSGRNENKLNALKKELKDGYHGRYTIALFDYSDLDSVRSVKKIIEDTLLDGIVIIPARLSLSPSRLLTSDEWLHMFTIGFVSPMELIVSLVPVMKANASIVVINGATSVCYLPEYKNLNVLRKMWVGQIKNLVYQLAEHKVRVNALSPGVIVTDYHRKKIQERAVQARRTMDEQIAVETTDIPLNKYGAPEDIAKATLFLLSSASGHINGINLIMDGGASKAY